MDTRCAVEQAARDPHGRLVAFLAARSHDVAAAEDALAYAFEAALETWPQSGVPQKPEAWLLTVARRRLIDNARHVRCIRTPHQRCARRRRRRKCLAMGQRLARAKAKIRGPN